MRLPWLVCSLIAGEVADRVDRRHLIWRTDVLRAVLLVALAALVATDRASLASLYTIAVLLGIGETFRDNAAQVIVPSLVAADRLEWANGRLASLETITNRFIGPPLGGLLAAISLTLPFVVDAASFAAAAVSVALIGGHYRPTGPDHRGESCPASRPGSDGCGSTPSSAPSPCSSASSPAWPPQEKRSWCSMPKTSSASATSATAS